MPAKFNTQGRDLCLKVASFLALYFACCSVLHTVISPQLSQHVMRDLRSQLSPIGISKITAKHQDLTAGYIMLQDVAIQWGGGNQTLRLPHLFISWQPKWTPPSQWISTITVSGAHLFFKSAPTLGLETLGDLQKILSALNSLPWPIIISAGSITHPEPLNDAATTPLAHYGFTLKTAPERYRTNLRLWRNAPHAHHLSVSYLPKTPAPAARPPGYSAPQAAPMLLRWASQYSELNIQLWPPATIQTNCGTSRQDRSCWKIFANGHTTAENLAELLTHGTLTHETSTHETANDHMASRPSALSRAPVTLRELQLELPAKLPEQQQYPVQRAAQHPGKKLGQQWLRFAEGSATLSIHDLEFPFRSPALDGIFGLTGDITLQLQPGNWAMTFQSPAEFEITLSTKASRPTLITVGMLASSLLPPKTRIRATGQIPENTHITLDKLSLNSKGSFSGSHFSFLSKDPITWNLDYPTQNIKGAITQFAIEKSDALHASGLFEATGVLSPEPHQMDVLTTFELNTTRDLLQLDLNGTALSGAVQWDLRGSINAANTTVELARTFVMKPFDNTVIADLGLLDQMPAPLDAIINGQKHIQPTHPLDNPLIIETSAFLPIAPYKNNAHLLSQLGLTPFALIIAPDLMMNATTRFSQTGEPIVFASPTATSRSGQITGTLDNVELEWFLSQLNVNFCRAQGTGALKFSLTPWPTPDTQTQIYYHQETPGFISCELTSNLVSKFINIQPNKNGRYFLPFQTMTVSQSASDAPTSAPESSTVSQQPQWTMRLIQGEETRTLVMPAY